MRCFTIFILILGLFSCSSKEKKLIQLSKEIMTIHDESMMEHGSIFKLKKQLKQKIEVTPDSSIHNKYIKAVLDMEKADEEMMDWMHTYRAPEEFLPYEEKLTYLENEKKKISDIRDHIHSSIVNAEEILK